MTLYANIEKNMTLYAHVCCSMKEKESPILYHFSYCLVVGFSQVFDGHNGASAAVFSKENLLRNVMSALPTTTSRDDWLAALPRALVAGFIKTDIDFQGRGLQAY